MCSDSYYRRCLELAQTNTRNKELIHDNVAMARYLFTHKKEYLQEAMLSAYKALGIPKPKQLELKVVE